MSLLVSAVALGGLWASAAALDRQATVTQTCRSQESVGVLPVWARAGFSDPRPRMPHAIGRDGRIIAIVFGYPLLSPPSAIRSNKILWVARVGPQSYSDLRISAQRIGAARKLGRPVARVVPGGPGPSIINLPAPGCWRFTLTWSGNADTIDLQYKANP